MIYLKITSVNYGCRAILFKVLMVKFTYQISGYMCQVIIKLVHSFVR